MTPPRVPVDLDKAQAFARGCVWGLILSAGLWVLLLLLVCWLWRG